MAVGKAIFSELFHVVQMFTTACVCVCFVSSAVTVVNHVHIHEHFVVLRRLLVFLYSFVVLCSTEDEADSVCVFVPP